MDANAAIVARVREFVESEVRPVAAALERADRYPHALVARMRELGLFGALVPTAYGGLGLDVTTYARIIEELCRGWMSLAGVINSHTMAALIVLDHGTDAQRARFLPRFARGEARGGLCLTEPHAGSDVQAIRTVARRGDGGYVLNGTKMFVTNGREGNTFAVLAVTDSAAAPRHRGMSCFIVEKGHPGLRVAQSIGKLGYKGVDTAELVFEDVVVPADHLVGGVEGRGFKHVMSGLEAGRINIAARAVGVAQAALDEALHQVRADDDGAAAMLADMATRLAAARTLTYWAAGMKDRGERCDLEAGMAKLAASEAAQELAVLGLRVHGEVGQLTTLPAERLYRDTPLMIIGEGTNEIQRLVIARQLLERFGERGAAPGASDGEQEERRRLVLAVRQVVDKEIVPVVPEYERDDRYPEPLMRTIADLGILGALVPPDLGGLGLDLATSALIVEELARGWTTVAAVVATHLVATDAFARFATDDGRRRLPAMMRGDLWAASALSGAVRAVRDDGALVLTGATGLVDNAARARVFVVLAGGDDATPLALVVERTAPGLAVELAPPTIGTRGLGAGHLVLDRVRVAVTAALGADVGREAEAAGRMLAVGRLGLAATAVGLAQAAFEAALRYSRERTAFGKAICQHQAVQLKLADMATAITAARLLATHAAERLDTAGDDLPALMARLHATEVAAQVTLEAMRIHGGYGYTTDFPVERYYRDAPRLLVALGGNDAERRDLGNRLLAQTHVRGGLGAASRDPQSDRS
jgi:alkylation response protein AidB-like acyl-CoA dehydrogenase